MTADAIELGAIAAQVARIFRIGRHAHRLKPSRSPVDDVRNAGHSLDVVDDRWLAKSSLDGGKRRFDSRPGPFPFQTLNQTGFFSTNVGPGAPMQVDVEIKSVSKNVVS